MRAVYVLEKLLDVSEPDLIEAGRYTISLGIKRLLVYGDSAVVVNQVNKDWDCTKDNMDAYCVEVHKLEKNFQGL
jgi:ribonuclease HI